jgi:hypothetical protein
VDPVRNDLIKKLAIGRGFWEMKGTRDNKMPIRVDDDALIRFNEFRVYITQFISTLPQVDILRAPIERLTISVIKVAALFAMHETSTRITLDHMLAAIELAEDWYYDLVRIASMVSESAWQREVTKLETFIVSKGGRTAYETAYKQFPGTLPMDFRVMIEALEYRGVLSQHKVGPRMILEINYGGQHTDGVE